MKIHQNSTPSQPVTLTLESKDELALFVRLLGAVTFNIADEFNLKHYELCKQYDSLEDLLEDKDKYPLLDITGIKPRAVPSTECVINEESKDTEVDWSEVPVGTPIEVCDDLNEEWFETEFKHYFSTDDYPFMTVPGNHWKYARLIQE